MKPRDDVAPDRGQPRTGLIVAVAAATAAPPGPVDNLSVAKGRHQLKFGVDYRSLSPFSVPFSYNQYVQFSGMTPCPEALYPERPPSPLRRPNKATRSCHITCR